MIVNPPFPVPDVVVIDPISGYAINIPLGFQVAPGWVDTYPEDYKRILQMRKDQNIEIEDDMLPSNESTPDPDADKYKRRTTPAPLPKTRRGKASKRGNR